MRAVLKKILQNARLRRFLCALGALYIRFVHVTSRWRVVGGAFPRAFWDEGKPFILCFWHGRLLMMPYSWERARPIHMLISRHRDGRLIADTVGHFGIHTVAGSSTHGGGAALRSMVKRLKAGECVGITPDGPAGPRMRASLGIAQVARMAGVPVIAAAYSCRPRKILKSWDRFVVALPFSRGVFVWGAPVEVPANASPAELEAARKAIEQRLNAVTETADLLCREEAIEPDAREWRAGTQAGPA